MLTAKRDLGRLATCYDNVVDEAGERGDAADEEGGDGAPVATESGRVAVDAVEVVHVGYGHITTSDDVVAVTRENRLVNMHMVYGIVGDELGHENRCHRTQENGVAAEESKEFCG